MGKKRPVRFLRLSFGVAGLIFAVAAALFGNSGPARAANEIENIRKLATGVFIVARTRLRDANFSKAVVLLTHYGREGAMGVIINRPTKIPLSTALPGVEEFHSSDDKLYYGGPVSRHLLVMLFDVGKDTALEGARKIFDNVYFSASLKSLMDHIGNSGGSHGIRGFSGYAGWGPGQLEMEIARGDWAVREADSQTIFETQPDDIWPGLEEQENRLRWI